MSDNEKPRRELTRTQDTRLHANGQTAGSLIDQSFTRLTDDEMSHLRQKAGEEALRLEVKHREQQMDYSAGRKSAEDHIDVFNSLEREGRTTRHSMSSEIKTGAGKMNIESKSGATCFVASAVYDDPNHPEVMFLRWFRDEVMHTHRLGHLLIALYWRVGPILARGVRRLPRVKRGCRIGISWLVKQLSKRYEAEALEIERAHHERLGS